MYTGNIFISRLSVYTYGDITTHVKQSSENGQVCPRKERPDLSDLERYADIITAYRDLLKLSALEPDIITASRGRYCTPPEDRDKLLKWVEDPKNLDRVAEAFRRVCSGYVSTNRLFAVRSGPLYYDWPAVLSILETGIKDIGMATGHIEMLGRTRTVEAVDRLEAVMDELRQIKEALSLSFTLGSLPMDARPSDVQEAGQ